MLKKFNCNNENTSSATGLILRSARKRRSMAVAAAKSVNSQMGITPHLVSVK